MTLQPGILTIFASAATIWIIWQAMLFVLAKTTPAKFAIDMIPLIIASLLLGLVPNGIITTVYKLALGTMSSVAGLAFAVGGDGSIATSTGTGDLVSLIELGEKGIAAIFAIAEDIAGQTSWKNWFPWVYALLIVIPYFLLIVSYVSQLIVAIFRLIIVSVFSPFLIMGFGFKFGRSMAAKGLSTVLSTIMVIFAATSALALAIYGVTSLDIKTIKDVSITHPDIIMAIALGWMGTALMTEGVGMANSIMGTFLSNTAAGVMTAGAAGSAAAVAGAAWKHKGAAGSVGAGAVKAAGALTNPAGAAGAAAKAIGGAAASKMDKFKEFYNAGKNFSKGDK